MSAEDEKRIESPAPRRTFLKQGLVGIVGLAAAGAIPPEALAQESSSDHLPRIATPLKSQRILKSESTGEAPRQQYYLETEFIGSNDVKLITKDYFKRTDVADAYDIVTIRVVESYLTSADSKPAKITNFASSVSGLKGQVDGDYRLDTTTTTTSFSSEGIVSDGAKQIKVLLPDPSQGMPIQERLDAALRQKGVA